MAGLVGQNGRGVQPVGLVEAPGAEQRRQRATPETNFQAHQVAQRLAALWRRAGVTAEYVQGEPGAALLDALQGLQGAFKRGERVGVIQTSRATSISASGAA